MKQLPGRKSDAIIRVQMDEAELNHLLGPILKEVNALRRRVETLETSLEKAVDCLTSFTSTLEVLAADFQNRQDDGK